MKDINEINRIAEYMSLKRKGLYLMNKKNALKFLNELADANIRVSGFEGFRVGFAIKPIPGFKITDDTVQSDQDFSRDYSDLNQELQYQKCFEYFAQDLPEEIFYDISFEGKALQVAERGILQSKYSSNSIL